MPKNNFEYQQFKVDVWFYGCYEDFIYYEHYLLGMKGELLLEGLHNRIEKSTATGFCYKKSVHARGSFDDLLRCAKPKWLLRR